MFRGRSCSLARDLRGELRDAGQKDDEAQEQENSARDQPEGDAGAIFARAKPEACSLRPPRLPGDAIEEENSWLQRHRWNGDPQWAEQATAVRATIE